VAMVILAPLAIAKSYCTAAENRSSYPRTHASRREIKRAVRVNCKRLAWHPAGHPCRYWCAPRNDRRRSRVGIAISLATRCITSRGIKDIAIGATRYPQVLRTIRTTTWLTVQNRDCDHSMTHHGLRGEAPYRGSTRIRCRRPPASPRPIRDRCRQP